MGELEGKRTFDEILDALAHIERRRLLHALLARTPQENESLVVDSDASSDDGLERAVQLHHRHLPKLEDYGFISWNRDTHEISKGPNFEKIRPLLNLLSTNKDELPGELL